MPRAPYSPQPGTLSFRAVEHLKSLGADVEPSTAELADALDTSINGLPTSLEYALKHGVLIARKDGRVLRWSLGRAGAPLPASDDEDDDPPRQIVVPADANPLGDMRWMLPFSAQTSVNGVKPARAKSVETAKTEPQPMRIALWSDGTLEIRRDSLADLVLFSRDEARAIVDYLNAIDLAVLDVEEAA